MKKVIIIQSSLPHYRVAFFGLLREKLKAAEVELQLIHGKHPQNPTYLPGNLPWATPVERIKIGPMCWHRNTIGPALAADLVIAPQEIRNVAPLLIQALRHIFKPRFAYWGHGKSFQTTRPNGISERIKRLLRNQAEWWFAYNDLSAKLVISGGFPAENVTSVINSIDTAKLSAWRSQLTQKDLFALRELLKIKTKNLAVFTGGMVPNKRLPFLLEALHEIRRQVPDFEMIFIGGGTERHFVTEAAIHHSWIHDIGPLSSKEIVPYWAISKLMLMPGLVGLVILDTFALGVPMATSDFPHHSPEIDYLEDGINGVMIRCGECSKAYADGVVQLLNDPMQIDRIREGALVSAKRYSIENMAENFARGVIAAIRS